MADPKGNLVTPVGHRSDGSIHALELDNSDQLKVTAVVTSSPIIVDGASPSLLRPDPKIGTYSNLNLPAGSSVQTLVTVPTGEVWRLKVIAYRYSGTVAGVVMQPSIGISSVSHVYDYKTGLVNNQFYFTYPDMILPADAAINVDILGATLNDNFFGRYFAERVY